MQACVDWVLITFGNQVINKKRPVRPAFPDYLSVSYDYDFMQACVHGVLITFGTQVINKKRPLRPVFLDCLPVSYDYGLTLLALIHN